MTSPRGSSNRLLAARQLNSTRADVGIARCTIPRKHLRPCRLGWNHPIRACRCCCPATAATKLSGAQLLLDEHCPVIASSVVPQNSTAGSQLHLPYRTVSHFTRTWKNESITWDDHCQSASSRCLYGARENDAFADYGRSIQSRSISSESRAIKFLWVHTAFAMAVMGHDETV
jgi:hypothetical protein